MEDNVCKTMMFSLLFLVLCITGKLISKFWWGPKSVEKQLRKQGVRGNSYKLFNGDVEVLKKCTAEALSMPISLNHQIVPRVMPFFHQMVENHGKVSLSWFGRVPRLIVADAELIRTILADQNGHFTKPPILNPLVELLQLGIATLEGEAWAKRRKLITPAFHFEKLKAMEPAFLASCCSLIDRWEKKIEAQGSCEVDVAPEFNILAGDVIARTAFGSSYEEGKMIFELQTKQVQLVREAYLSICFPGLRFIPTKKNKMRYQIYNQVKAILKDMIHKKEKEMMKGELKRDCLSSILLHCNGQSNNSLTSEHLIEECKLFYFAGQETTANLLTWTMVVFSMHQNWQEKARADVLDICGKKEPNFEAINCLKIVSMVLNEVLRLYPPVPKSLRYTKCATQIGSMYVPEGVEIYLPFMLLHYDENNWDNPEEFNPERFAEGVSKASKGQIAFYPFGWGPRICLGQNFALIEAKMALAMILQHFSFQLSPTYTHAPYDHITLKPQYGASIIVQSIN
ncbi:cytochrome P450 CYP72A219-like [Abrus precatorius]|uniref:Cytochrome P450 CYP72A219-like n=1 Tax=Abrus precatorius TaxID=3816 RepID=A0A8B8KCX1_ABRPR|nr:cytochrome P450 CYP72A219-like [Abrus precatorius]